MQILGYCIKGKKQYIAFREGREQEKHFKITDGFHDKLVCESKGNCQYCWVDQKEIDLKKIIRRLHGTRPWHPLLKLLRKEKEA